MKIGNISLTGKNQPSQSCSNHIVQSFTVLFYWKDNLFVQGEDDANKWKTPWDGERGERGESNWMSDTLLLKCKMPY